MKYFGGKTKLRDDLVRVIGPSIVGAKRFYEPFVGGGNATVALAPIAKQNGVPYFASDMNASMVACLSAIRDGWIPPNLSREQYRDILLAYRKRKAFAGTAIEGFALSACSFRGTWASGFCGPLIVGTAIRSAALMVELLCGVHFSVRSYHLFDPSDGDVVYCDPPYAGTNQVGGIAGFDVDAFWSWADGCVERGAKVFVSETCAPTNWTAVFECAHVNTSSPITGKKDKRVERIFTR